MEIVGTAQLNDTWDLVLCIREDNKEFPFIVTAHNKETKEFYWDMAFKDDNIKSGGIAICPDQNIAKRVFVQNIHLMSRIFPKQ